MSGWRKLLTPRTEKYLPHESNRSNLTQSKFGKDSSLKSSDREWLNGSLHNQKLQSLQSEMSKLKSQLGRYSQRQKSVKDPVFTPTESTDRRSPVVDENEEEENSSERQRYREDEINTYSERPVKDSNHIKFIGEYQDHEEENDEEKENYEHMQYENKRGGYREKNSNKERESYKYRNEVNMSGNKQNYKERNRESSQSKKDRDFYGTGRKSGHYDKNENFIEKNEQDLQQVLINCQKEISGLKEVVLDSKKKIETLQEDLIQEKRETEQLRDELERRSIKPLQREIDHLHYESPLAKENRPENFGSSRGFRERQFQEDSRDHKWHSIDVLDEKQSQKFSSTRKGKSGTESKVPPSNYRSNTEGRSKESGIKERKQGEKWQNSIDYGRNARNASIQCDFMLENIIDVQEDLEKEQLREEVEMLRREIKELKAQKNDMIDSFQRIVETLKSSDKFSNGTGHIISELQGDFNYFYKDLESLLTDIHTYNTTHNLNLSRAFSPHRKPVVLSTLERSKTLESEHNFHDNQFDLPLKDEFTSFYDNLADSKNPLQYVSRLGSPSSRKNKEKTLFDSWRSHVQDLLSNNPKFH